MKAKIYLIVKNVFDRILSFIALVLILPVLAIIFIAIKLNSKGPAIFSQERIGRSGSVFYVYKFRTMVVDAESFGDGLTVRNSADPRITRVGRVLRATSLDELPQLFNVLIGDMSLVGPRPPVTYHPYKGYENYPEWARKRFQVRPGITGLVQTSVRNSVSWDERILIDNEYVDNMNCWLDIQILLKTVKRVVLPENIYMNEHRRMYYGEIPHREKQLGVYMNILILSCGSRNKIVQYFKNAFSGVGSVVATDMSELAPALYDADKYYIVSRIDHPNYLSEILNICKQEEISGVLSLIDPELNLLADNSELFAQMGVRVIGSNKDICDIALDKMKMYRWLKNHGYHYAKSYTEVEEFVVALKKNEIGFPVVVKPHDGSASHSISIVNDIENLVYLFANQPGLMIQELLQGDEFGVDCYIDMISGELVSIFAKKKVLMRAGETDKSISYKSEKLFSLVSRFVREMGYRGQIDIDIFKVDDEYYISEVNPRFGGGYPHAYEAGIDHMKLILKNLQGIINEKQIGEYDTNSVMMKYSELKYKP